MAKVNYWNITLEVRERIADGISTLFPKAAVTAEEEFSFAGQWVGVYLRSRVAPDRDQTISAGKRTRFQVTFEIWVWGYGPTFPIAAQARDDLLGAVEIALMEDRSLDDSVEGAGWIEGGEFQAGSDPKDGRKFWAGASIRFTTYVSALTS